MSGRAPASVRPAAARGRTAPFATAGEQSIVSLLPPLGYLRMLSCRRAPRRVGERLPNRRPRSEGQGFRLLADRLETVGEVRSGLRPAASGYPRRGWRAVVAAESRYGADIGSLPLRGGYPREARVTPLARSRASAGLLAPSLAERDGHGEEADARAAGGQRREMAGVGSRLRRVLPVREAALPTRAWGGLAAG